MFNIIKKPHRPSFSIFVPFTRLWVVEKFLKSLEAMDLDKEHSELIFYNDTRDEDLHKVLLSWLVTFGQEFNGAGIYQSGKQLPNEFDVALRRERICDMKEKSKKLMSDTDYVFCLEDDTIAPPNSFIKLLDHIQTDSSLGIVSGVEVGRWTVPMIGAWEIEPLDDPQTIRSIPYRKSGTQNVDACGWYCYITPTKLYKEAHYRQESEPLGPCETYTWDLRRAGYQALVDWGLPCEHLQEYGEGIIPKEDNTSVLTWNKGEDGRSWTVEDVPPTKLVLQSIA